MDAAQAPAAVLSGKRVCRILVDSLADQGLTNAQMTNAREIVARLDPEQFHVSLFHVGVPDERIRKRPNTELISLPLHGQTLRILREFVFGSHEILFYPKIAPASRWYMELRKISKDRHVVVGTVESRSDLRNGPNLPKHIARMWQQTVLRSDYLFSNSRAVKESLKREFGIESEVVPTGVDTSYFVPPITRILHSRPRVLFVGSLRPFKQPQLLLAAARRFPQADFVIVGEGVLAADLEQQKKQENLTNVTLAGPLGPSELLRQYQAADLFFFPSRWEGSPKVILEAAACGLPVIARSSYEPEGVIGDRTGFLGVSDDDLIARLQDLLASEDLRRSFGSKGRRHAESFDWDHITQRWADIFRKLAPKVG
jgi:glycosyltransferase involved in cell wall biosynthesis